jgi:hypothetical protein
MRRMNALLTQFPTPIHPHFASQSLETHPLHVHKQIFHVMTTYVSAADVSEFLDRLHAAEREKAKLEKLLKKVKASCKASPKSKKTISKSSTSSGDKKVGYVCVNEEYYGLSVYENSAGRYVNDGGKRINANRFKISKTKPK